MISENELIDKILARLSDQVAASVRETVDKAVREAVSAAMTESLVEGEFYRALNTEMLSGLKGIFQEINDAPGVISADDASQTTQLFSETTNRIEEVMETTQQASDTIMQAVEQLQDDQEKAGSIIAVLEADEKALAQLDILNSRQGELLTEIMTACSFEDLTGQRLKKVMASIASIRETVFDLYVSSGLMVKEMKENPKKAPEKIVEESKLRTQEIKNSELKGPSKDANQTDVDDLLASLGL